jgi:hypothetical protein
MGSGVGQFMSKLRQRVREELGRRMGLYANIQGGVQLSLSVCLSVGMSVFVLSCDETGKTGQDRQDKGGICLVVDAMADADRNGLVVIRCKPGPVFQDPINAKD